MNKMHQRPKPLRRTLSTRLKSNMTVAHKLNNVADAYAKGGRESGIASPLDGHWSLYEAGYRLYVGGRGAR